MNWSDFFFGVVCGNFLFCCAWFFYGRWTLRRLRTPAGVGKLDALLAQIPAQQTTPILPPDS